MATTLSNVSDVASYNLISFRGQVRTVELNDIIDRMKAEVIENALASVDMVIR